MISIYGRSFFKSSFSKWDNEIQKQYIRLGFWFGQEFDTPKHKRMSLAVQCTIHGDSGVHNPRRFRTKAFENSNGRGILFR
jgi:hypothetical protein